MKNIILQHWAGNRPDWSYVAERTVKTYAESIGADYNLFLGFPVGKRQGPNAQKVYMLDECWDEYDQVLMLDMDTIASSERSNVFNRPEIGVLHDRAMIGPHRSRTPNGGINLYKQGAPVFFGNFLKLNVLRVYNYLLTSTNLLPLKIYVVFPLMLGQHCPSWSEYLEVSRCIFPLFISLKSTYLTPRSPTAVSVTGSNFPSVFLKTAK